MMSFLQSILGLLCGRLIVKTAMICVPSDKTDRQIFNGVEICCLRKEHVIVREALERVAQFYGCEGERYKTILKKIVINESINTNVIISQRTTIIKRSDVSRMTSAVHLAGWLIADVERLMVFKKNYCGLIVWKASVPSEANKSALEQRKKYLSERDSEGRGR